MRSLARSSSDKGLIKVPSSVIAPDVGLSSAAHKPIIQHFFENNFVIKDPNVAGGIRYYQGKILIRTRKPQDDMNVLIKFCPDPEALYIQTPFGRQLNPAAIVTTEALSETEADRIERDPNEVDLMIRFKDTQAILGLAGRPNVDVAQLLIENLVQITGNFGHMFKFGAIGMNVQMAMKDFL